MRQESNNGPGDFLTVRNTVNWGYFLCLCHASAFYPFFRRNFGIEAMGFNGVGAVLLMLGVAVYAADGLMFLYLCAWIVLQLRHRWQSLNAWATGHVVHSRYCGEPSVGLRFVKRHAAARRFVEPLICLAIGGALYSVCEVLGLFILSGAFSLVTVEALEWQAAQVRLRQLRDAEIEQHYLAHLYRGGEEE